MELSFKSNINFINYLKTILQKKKRKKTETVKKRKLKLKKKSQSVVHNQQIKHFFIYPLDNTKS